MRLPRRALPRAGRRRVDRIHRPHVGIVSTYFNRKGVATDARAMEFGLSGQAFVFPVQKLSDVQRRGLRTRAVEVDPDWQHAQVAPTGMALGRWLDVAQIDLLIASDHFLKDVFDACRARGIKTCFAPHLESLETVGPRDARRMPGTVDIIAAKSRRTASVVRALTDAPVHTIPWSTFWPIEEPTSLHDPVCVYYNLGIGGLSDRRHAPLVLDTLTRLLPKHPHVRAVVKCHPHVRKYHPDLRSTHERMVWIEEELPLDRMIALQRDADLTLYPSRFEGLGYPLLESLHCGVPVVTTDASPMNEFVQDGENGWIVPCTTIRTRKRADVVEADGPAFEALLDDLFTHPDKIAAMKARCTDTLPARAAAFRAGWRGLVRRLFPRMLNVGAGEDANLAAYNMDIRAVPGVDVVAQADALPFAPGAFVHIEAYDVLEHVPQEAGPALLREWTNALAAGGELQVRVPDLRALAEQYRSGKIDTERFALWLYGRQDHDFNFHKAGYDEAAMRALFSAAGLTDLRRTVDGESSKNILLRGRNPARRR